MLVGLDFFNTFSKLLLAITLVHKIGSATIGSHKSSSIKLFTLPTHSPNMWCVASVPPVFVPQGQRLNCV